MTGGRTIGIDFGTKRVGLAIADPLNLFSQPVGTYSPDEVVDVLKRLKADEGLALIVIGWPFEEDGSEGKATERVQNYLNRLANLFPKTRFVKHDERYTTHQARELIKAGSKPLLKKSGRGRVDTAAACIILQEYLEDAY